MPEFGINDLPDETRLEEDSKYLLTGKSLRALITVCRKMWRGDNVTVPLQGGSIRKDEQGDAGYNLFVPTVQPGSGGGSDPSWPWKVYNTTTGTTGQVQINGGDGFVASLNGTVAKVGGVPVDNQTGMPPAYPQLSVTANGYIYAFVQPTTAGDPSSFSSLDILADTSVPSNSPANPQSYVYLVIATISGFATDGSGNVSFQVNNTTNTGFATLIYCAGDINIY